MYETLEPKIVIPRTDLNPRPFRDIELPITPVTDGWLVARERTWEEIDHILEGRLGTLQSSFEVKRKNPGTIAEAYGIEKTPNTSTARLLAYTELVDEYRFSQQLYLGKVKNLKDEFEVKRREIYRAKESLSAKKRQSDALWKQQYNPAIFENTQRARNAEGVHMLILRKAVMEIFSSGGDTRQLLSNFPRLVTEARETLAQHPNTKNQQLSERKPVDYFIDSLSSYLLKTNDESLFSRYNYRKTQGLIAAKQDTDILDMMLRYALDSETVTSHTETAQELQKLGNAYFMFLRKRAKSLNNPTEPYPHLSLLYDIYTTAIVNGKPTVLKGLVGLTEPYFADILRSKIGTAEIGKFVTSMRSKAAPAYGLLARRILHSAMQNEEYKDLHILDHVKESLASNELINSITSDEFRIYAGLTRLNVYSQSNIYTHGRVRSAQIFDEQFDRLGGSRLSGLKPEFEARIDVELQKFARASIYKTAGIDIDLNAILHGYVLRAGTIKLSAEATINTKLNELISLFGQLNALNLADEIVENDFFTGYLNTLWEEYPSSTETVERESTYLRNEVLNNPDWFVSSRGDRFKVENDLQLADYAIESVTFYPDKSYPREHRIQLKLRDIDQTFDFWPDIKGNLLGFAHQVLPINPELRNKFVNLILKRLYSITSGKFSEPTEESEEGEGTRLLEYRRAHYRHLFSTPEHPISLESHGAQKHAREIEEDYGIRIIPEIMRRRALGTLQQNEFITFVRETTPTIPREVVIPKDLAYDPTFIQIPT